MGSTFKENEKIVLALFQGRWLSQLNFIRNKHKHNISKPRLPHFERHVVEHVCSPIFLQKKKPQYLPDIDACNSQPKTTKNFLMDKLCDILAKEALDKIRSSKLIGFFHLNTFEDDEIFKFRVLLKKNEMKYVYYKKSVMLRALTGTDYEPALQLFKGPTVMVTSTEIQLPKLLKVSKKIKKVVLMAALYENRLLSYSELKYYGEYENLDAARMKLVHTLTSSSQYIVQQINQHPNILVQCLNQRLEHLKKNDATS